MQIEQVQYVLYPIDSNDGRTIVNASIDMMKRAADYVCVCHRRWHERFLKKLK
jgi:hypothetical protein